MLSFMNPTVVPVTREHESELDEKFLPLVLTDPRARARQKARLQAAVAEHVSINGPLPEARVRDLAERAATWPD